MTMLYGKFRLKGATSRAEYEVLTRSETNFNFWTDLPIMPLDRAKEFIQDNNMSIRSAHTAGELSEDEMRYALASNKKVLRAMKKGSDGLFTIEYLYDCQLTI